MRAAISNRFTPPAVARSHWTGSGRPAGARLVWRRRSRPMAGAHAKVMRGGKTRPSPDPTHQQPPGGEQQVLVSAQPPDGSWNGQSGRSRCRAAVALPAFPCNGRAAATTLGRPEAQPSPSAHSSASRRGRSSSMARKGMHPPPPRLPVRPLLDGLALPAWPALPACIASHCHAHPTCLFIGRPFKTRPAVPSSWTGGLCFFSLIRRRPACRPLLSLLCVIVIASPCSRCSRKPTMGTTSQP